MMSNFFSILCGLLVLLAGANTGLAQVQSGTFRELQPSEVVALVSAPEWRAHPEFGQLPPDAPCTDCAEVLALRSAHERVFVRQSQTHNSVTELAWQKSHWALHYRDANGWIRSIDPTWTSSSEGFQTAAMPMPVQVGTNGVTRLHHSGQTLALTKVSVGPLESLPPQLTYTNESVTELAGAACAACGRAVVTRYPGLGLSVYRRALKSGGVKVNYIIESLTAIDNQTPDYRIFQGLTLPAGARLSTDPLVDRKPGFGYAGPLYVRLANGQAAFTIGDLVVYDAQGRKLSAYYALNDLNELEIRLSFAELSAAALPVVVDPTVTCGPALCPTNTLDVATQPNQRIPSCPLPTFSPSEAISFTDVPALYRIQSVTFSGGFEGSGLSSDPASCNNVWEGKGSLRFRADCGSEVVLTPNETAANALADAAGSQVQYRACAAPADLENIAYQLTQTSTALAACYTSPQCTPFNVSFQFGLTRNCQTLSACSDQELYASACNTIAVTLNLLFDPAAVNPATPFLAGPVSLCEGQTGTYTLATSEVGVQYQLQANGVNIGAQQAGTGAGLSFNVSTLTAAGSPYVIQVLALRNGCSVPSNGLTLTVSALPGTFALSAQGACANANGSATLAGSETGVNYTLQINSVNQPGTQTGTGGALNFTVPGQPTGTYNLTVLADNGQCTRVLGTGTQITFSTTPLNRTLTGPATPVCNNATANIVVQASENGVTYQLYRDGFPEPVPPVVGNGANRTITTASLNNAGSPYTFTVLARRGDCEVFMTGSVVVSVAPALTPFNILNTDTVFCENTVYRIRLDGSQSGVQYRIINTATNAVVSPVVVGTGNPISLQLNGTNPGGVSSSTNSPYTFVVRAQFATAPTCPTQMTGQVNVTVLPIAQSFSLSGSTSLCEGQNTTLTLSGSQASVSYQLLRDGVPVGLPVSGTGSALSFPVSGLPAGGPYALTVAATLGTCTTTMTNTVAVTVSAAPTVFTVSPSVTICEGQNAVIGLSGSQAGTNYQVFDGATAVSTVVNGTGNAITLSVPGLSATGSPYTLTVRATNANCTQDMGTANVQVNALPQVFSVSGGGSACEGSAVVITLSGSQPGYTYQLFENGSPVGVAQAGTGSSITFSPTGQLVGPTYNYTVQGAIGACVANMAGGATFTFNPLPTLATVTTGSTICEGQDAAVTLTNTVAGTTYQLVDLGSGALLGSSAPGTGGALTLTAPGLVNAASPYQLGAIGTLNGCSAPMSGSATVTVNAQPTLFTVGGTSPVCLGDAAIVTLSSSEPNVLYQVLDAANNPVGAPQTGTGAPLSFSIGGLVVAGSPYTFGIRATLGTCTRLMAGNATVIVVPVPTALSVSTPVPAVCENTPVVVEVSGSELGVTYEVYSGTILVATAAGTGSTLPIPVSGLSVAGSPYTLTVRAVAGTCSTNMLGSAAVSVQPQPQVFTVGGSATICSGGTAIITLNNSEVGAFYQLFQDGVGIGFPVAGTGSPLAIPVSGLVAPGPYNFTVEGSLGICVSPMANVAVITITPPPSLFTVSGSATICEGDIATVTLGGSDVGITYSLLQNETPTGQTQTGNGSALTFNVAGLTQAGAPYTFTVTGTLNGCDVAMNGSAIVDVRVAPSQFTVSGTQTICAGQSATITLSGSESGISYQLLNAGVPAGAAVAGTGAALAFTASGLAIGGPYTFTVEASANGCVRTMDGSALVTVSANPQLFTVAGTQTICDGDAAVVTLSGSELGVSYTPVVNGTSLPFSQPGTGVQISLSIPNLSSAGSPYNVTVQASNGSCQSAMTGSAVVTVIAQPTAFQITGGGTVCQGQQGTFGLQSSQAGVSYQVFRNTLPVGTPVIGTGGPLTFQTGILAPGTYTFTVSGTSGSCTQPMLGSAVVTVVALPQVFPISAPTQVCEGSPVNVTVGNSENGFTYVVQDNFGIQYGTGLGTGSPLQIPVTTALVNAASPYTLQVVATNGSGCTQTMSGTVTITVNPLPLQFTVAGSTVCQGQVATVQLSASQAGVSYQLLDAANQPFGAAINGGASPLTFSISTPSPLGPGTYTFTVRATNNQTCQQLMANPATVTVIPTPQVFTVTGSTVCFGQPATVSLAGSQVGTDYIVRNTLTNQPVGAVQAGTGQPLSFSIPNLAVGTYSFNVFAQVQGCEQPMGGPVQVTVNQLPFLFNVTGGGTFCQGQPVQIAVSSQQANASYQLQDVAQSPAVNYLAAVQGSSSGTGFFYVLNNLSAGTYTFRVRASLGTCDTLLNGTAQVTVTPLPQVFNIQGGTFCENQPAIITIQGSEDNVQYTAFNSSGVAVGSPVTGNSANPTTTIAITTLPVGGPYTFTVRGTLNGCVQPMSGTASITIQPEPQSFAFTFGQPCEGLPVLVNLTSSQSGVTYQPLINGAVVATPQTSPANGTPLTFSIPGLTASGSPYTLQMQATLGNCPITMPQQSQISIQPLPQQFNLTPVPSTFFCANDDIVLEQGGSEAPGQTTVSYQLLNLTSGQPTGSPVLGSGAPLTFTVGGGLPAGTYTFAVQATRSNGCVDTLPSVTVSVIPRAIPYNGTVSSNSICDGDPLTVTLANSQTGYDYEVLDQNDISRGASQPGIDGSPLTWTVTGLTSTQAPYTLKIRATIQSNCPINMLFNQVINVFPRPLQFDASLETGTVITDRTYCEGEDVRVYLLQTQTDILYTLLQNGVPVPPVLGGNGPEIAWTISNLPGSAAGTPYTYRVAALSLNGCPDTMNTTLTARVFRRPTAPVVGANDQICEEDAGIVQVLNSEPGYQYQAIDANGVPFGAPQLGTGGLLNLPILGLTAGQSPYTFGVRAYPDGAPQCSTVSANTSQVIVRVRPQITVSPGEQICLGQTAVFTADASGPWYSVVNGTYIELTLQNTNTVSLPTLTLGPDTVVFFNGACYDTLAYEVVPQPEFTLDLSGGVCIGATKTVTSNIPVNWTYFTQGTAQPVGVNTTSVNLTFSVEGVDSILIQAGGCRALMVVPVRRPFQVSLAASDPDRYICEGTPVTFTATGPDGIVYTFLRNGSPVQTSTSKTWITTNLSDGDQIFVRGEDNEGCRVPSDTLDFTVETVPVADYQSVPPAGVPIKVPQATIQFTNLSSSGNTFFWTFGDGTSSFDENPVHSYTYPDTFTVRLVVSNNECSDTLSKQYVVVDVPPVIEFPNAFTPNFDDRNNLFEVKYYRVETMRVLIYNQWGTKVFDNDGDLNKFWDGTYNGNICPEDIYFYYAYGQFNAKDNYGNPVRYERSGTITLIR
jgi:gliding motility-associated-like protein